MLTMLSRTLLLAAVVVSLTATSAYAAVVTARYEGLFLTVDGFLVAEIDRTTNVNNLVQKDTSSASGDNMRIQIPFRDRSPFNGKAVHASIDWKKHALNCGISGIEIHVTGGGVSSSCNEGWDGNGHSESSNVSDGAWYFFNSRKFWNGTDGSLRGGIHVCQAQWNSDPCTNRRWVTTFWN